MSSKLFKENHAALFVSFSDSQVNTKAFSCFINLCTWKTTPHWSSLICGITHSTCYTFNTSIISKSFHRRRNFHLTCCGFLIFRLANCKIGDEKLWSHLFHHHADRGLLMRVNARDRRKNVIGSSANYRLGHYAWFDKSTRTTY